ncbi:hypothetical protein SAMN05421788_102141 [Filimonas lacunae]|uniref:Uncharacterized protein n=1 Tax=Filimonas lacunae TaxID=477680 RepID=A0A1N7N3D3_9BACT|nr:hypothetical protein SAMN05421788_102141 [Filimonas lacunae]
MELLGWGLSGGKTGVAKVGGGVIGIIQLRYGAVSCSGLKRSVFKVLFSVFSLI